jgi:hypothetical protein
MLSSFVTAGRRSSQGAALLPLGAFSESGAFGTGSWTDTSPRFGCCAATEVAIRELAANAAASNFSLTGVRSHPSLVPVWELVDFVGCQFAPTRLLFSQN